MVEIKFPGIPLYQLKIHDTGDGGIGVIVRADSDFLNHIDVGQELEVGLIAPTEDYQKPSGHYLSKIEHITEIQEGPLSGHILVGLAFLNQIPTERPPIKSAYRSARQLPEHHG
jgi:hypothetical protein